MRASGKQEANVGVKVGIHMAGERSQRLDPSSLQASNGAYEVPPTYQIRHEKEQILNL